MDKTILLASFIFNERLDWFYGYLESKFKIRKDNVFVYKNLDDESRFIVTFKLKLFDGKKINFTKHFPNAFPIHKKGNALYTINALNMLIEKDFEASPGNVDYAKFEIDWSKYQNNMILTNKEDLIIYNIKRIF